MTAAPLILAAAALYNWTIAPHVGYLHAMQRLEPVMGKMSEELDAVAGTLEEKLSTMRTLRQQLAKVREGLFRPAQARSFFHDLQTLVETTGCVMKEADFTRDGQSQGPEDPNATMTVEASHADMTVAGSYEQIVSLLQTLQQRPQKVWVDSCSLDLVDPRSGRLECRLGLTLYAHQHPGELPQ